MSPRPPDDDVAPPPSGGTPRGEWLSRDWLERREPAAPDRLSARMRAALDQLDAEPEDTPSVLGAAALTCLRSALAKGNHRDAALDLLAADALLTYGCEAAAQAGPVTLERFANEYGAVQLAALLPAGP